MKKSLITSGPWLKLITVSELHFIHLTGQVVKWTISILLSLLFSIKFDAVK